MDQSTDGLLTPDIIQMLVSSMTQQGTAPLSQFEAERFLNALARVRSGVPTGAQSPNGHDRAH